MFENIKGEKNNTVTRIKEYGYKAGYRHLFDTFSLLLDDLDAHARADRNVCLICHDCSTEVPNPQGQDWTRWEPRLTQNDRFCQLRQRVKEWADHVLFIGYDVAVDKDGVGHGAGTRTLHTFELPHCMAKSRGAQLILPVNTNGADIWKQIL